MDKVMVDTSRIRTRCFVSGPEEGEPVLCVHGNITTGRFWQDVADGFPGGYRLVAPDLRSFGRTKRKPVDASRGLQDRSDDLHALVPPTAPAAARTRPGRPAGTTGPGPAGARPPPSSCAGWPPGTSPR